MSMGNEIKTHFPFRENSINFISNVFNHKEEVNTHFSSKHIFYVFSKYFIFRIQMKYSLEFYLHIELNFKFLFIP